MKKYLIYIARRNGRIVGINIFGFCFLVGRGKFSYFGKYGLKSK